MSVLVVCPKCQMKLKVEDNAFGKAIKCPGCAALFMVKAPAATAPAPAPPPPAPPPRAMAPPVPEKKAAGPVPDWAKDDEDVSRKARLARKSRKDEEDDDRRK